MSRPWTAIAKERSSGHRQVIIFEGSFDGGTAVNDFKEKYSNFDLEGLIPGDHPYTIVQNKPKEQSKGVDIHQMFSGF